MKNRFQLTFMTACLMAFLVSFAAPLDVSASNLHKAKPTRHLAQTGTVIAFGQQGGNIRPFAVTVSATGVVSVSGPVHVANPNIHVSVDTLHAILKLADAEGFFAMPSVIASGAPLNPDVAVPYITINSVNSAKTVHSRGMSNEGFRQLWSVLMAIAGATFGG